MSTHNDPKRKRHKGRYNQDMRRLALLACLRTWNTAPQLALALNRAEQTLRRDLVALEEEGLVERRGKHAHRTWHLASEWGTNAQRS